MSSVSVLKDTEYEWIGSIPSHWELLKIKYVFWDRKENNNPIKTDNLISLTIDKGVIPHSEKTGGGNKPKEDLSKYKLVYPGDIVLNSMNVIAGAVGISKYFGVVSPVYYMLIPRNVDHSNEYFHHLFRTETFQKSLYGLGNGILIKENEETGKLNTIRMRIPMDKLGNQFIPVPPPKEQKLISRYLDKKTEQIDSLIEKIQKKIELLKEQRTSLINQCVTKGLDPNVEMKDSGIEWIGEIPKHWELKKLKHISTVDLSSVDRHEHADELQVNICHYPDVYRNEFISEKTLLPNGTCSESEFRKFSLQVGDILLTKDSESPDDIGIPTFVLNPPENTVCGYHIAILRLRTPEHHSGYLYRFIESKNVKDYFYTVASGITRFGLGKGSLENLIIPCPPLDEQTEISGKISNLSSTNSSISQKLKDKIHLLTEYRESLISSVVTGKVLVAEDMI